MTLKDIREGLGLTQAEFAQKLGTTQISVSRWENGIVQPGIEYLRKVAALGGCRIEDIAPTVRRLKMRETLTREAYEGLTAEERRYILKVEQAKEFSGWRRYPTTMDRLVERVPSEWWEKYSAEHIGEVMSMLKKAHDDGVSYGRAHEE